MKDVKILISSLLIICSFFLWYIFAQTEQSQNIDDNKRDKTYINVESKGKKIQIDTENPDVILLLNGQETSSGSIVIE